MEPQLQNWHNFCQYHANSDWHGTWTRYFPDGQVIESFQCIRSFHVSEDGSEIHHQNHYTYGDGKKETKTFGPYKKPFTRALFLDNSFSWGSTKVESSSNFGFETGFRYEDRRASVAIVYEDHGSLQKIVVIPENLKSSQPTPPVELTGNWQGTSKTMTTDWIVSSPIAISWNPQENENSDYLKLNFSDGISINCPRQVESGKEFFVAVNWLVNPTLLHRGIRNYNTEGFTSFTLEILTTEF